MSKKEHKNQTIKSWKENPKEDRDEALNTLLKYYGDEEVFKRRQEEGYTRASFGVGPWFHMDLRPDGYIRFIDSGRIKMHKIKINDNPTMTVLPAEAIRIVGVWIFFHPNGRVVTYENIKIDAYGWKRRGPKIETIFNNEKELDKFISDYGIKYKKDKLLISGLLPYFKN